MRNLYLLQGGGILAAELEKKIENNLAANENEFNHGQIRHKHFGKTKVKYL